MKYFGVQKKALLDISKVKDMARKMGISFKKSTRDDLIRSVGKELFCRKYLQKKDEKEIISHANLTIEKVFVRRF